MRSYENTRLIPGESFLRLAESALGPVKCIEGCGFLRRKKEGCSGYYDRGWGIEEPCKLNFKKCKSRGNVEVRRSNVN